MKIEKNIGPKDRQIRLVLAAALLLLSVFVNFGVLEILVWPVAAILVLTSLFNFCPAYKIFGKSTCA